MNFRSVLQSFLIVCLVNIGLTKVFAYTYDLAINKIVQTPPTYASGDIVAYQLVVQNQGTGTIGFGLTVNDYLTDGMLFTGAWSSSEPSVTLTSGIGGSTINRSIPAIFFGETITIDYLIVLQTGGDMLNTAEVLPGGGDPVEGVPYSAGSCDPANHNPLSGDYAVAGTNNIDCEEISVAGSPTTGQCGTITEWYDPQGDGNSLSGGTPGLCTNGTVAVFSYNGALHQWTWNCLGTNGGGDDFCTASEFYCSDSIVSIGFGEQCDDGNQLDGDGCSSLCQICTDFDNDGYCLEDWDCDDSHASVYSGAPEICDGLDNNCDSFLSGVEIDDDGDGYVECTVVASGWAGTGGVFGGDDCDDTTGTYSPGNAELCDGFDNNCNSLIDDADPVVTGVTTFYYDGDSDTYGTSAVFTGRCIQPVNYVLMTGDCNDGDNTVYSGAAELCDGQDNNCNGIQLALETDNDGDLYIECTFDAGGWDGDPAIISGGDCDDTAGVRYPGNAEVCDGLDNNCDLVIPTNEVDDDSDGYVECTIIGSGWAGTGGVLGGDDCDDTTGAVYSGNVEVCDGLDNDCANGIDDGVLITFYLDSDGDNYGTSAVTTGACFAPVGYTGDDTDCNDLSGAINPASTETCDLIDNDCDGLIDDADPGIVGQSTWYADADSDSQGYAFSSAVACFQPVGYVGIGGDCNDNDNTVYLGAPELCDGLDTNCDSTLPADEIDNDGDNRVECMIDGGGWDGSGSIVSGGDCDDTDSTIYSGAPELCDGQDNDCDLVIPANEVDDDSDGYVECTFDGGGWDGTGAVIGDNDCDDTTGAVSPAATEICDYIDNDCDSLIDDADGSISGLSLWFQDSDSDGYGTSALMQVVCFQPTGFVLNGGDCNDGDNTIYPGGAEICDGLDNNCDSFLPANEVDNDGDNRVECAFDSGGWDGTGAVIGDNDCDDTDSTIYSGAVELCDGQDNDCDLTIPSNEVDDDSDGYVECTFDSGGWDGTGAVTGDNDCDDTQILSFPGNPEVCDLIDNDCNSLIDDGVQTTYYLDSDGDSYGTSAVTTGACSLPTGYALLGTDCDDTTASKYPGNQEICDYLDNDCDSLIDDTDGSVTGQSIWYIDTDSDLFGTSAMTQFVCFQPTGYVLNAGDCVDTDSTIYPGGVEICDGQDNNCDSFLPLNEVDNDGDNRVECTIDGGGRDGSGSILGGGDCNDAENTIYSGAVELCDGQDNDCDLTIPSNEVDDDSDGYVECTFDGGGWDGAGSVTGDNDCDDTEALAFPGNPEVCDLIDNDCANGVDDGVQTTYYLDNDGDSYGTSAVTTGACNLPGGYAFNSLDCDDNDGDNYPGNQEVCDLADNDCDGFVDDTDPSITGQTTWYLDGDLDGYGTGGPTVDACFVPGGYAGPNNDCDDASGAINPGATELCNGIDDNCGGGIDEGACPTLTYYCDSDGDGFTGQAASGSCATYNCVPLGCTTVQGNDCDDTDPLLYPGQEWYEDGDGDGYSNGIVVNACNQPTDYYLSGTLTALSGDNCPAVFNPAQVDGDGDGSGDLCDPAECGNSYLEVGEECDNTPGSGDGCDTSCQFETPSCTMSIQSATGVVPYSVVVTETFASGQPWIDYTLFDWEDGSTGVSPTFATSHTYPLTGSYVASLIVQNNLTGSTLTGVCYLLLEAGVTCGNGIQEAGESCDDGNLTGRDGCNQYCQLEGCKEPGAHNYDPLVEISDNSCVSCGDGIIQPGQGEECDDGNNSNLDYCLNTCINSALYLRSFNRGSSLRKFYVDVDPDSIAADIDPLEQHYAQKSGEETRSFIFQPQSVEGERRTNLVSEAVLTWSPLKQRIFFHLSEMFVAGQIQDVSKDTEMDFKTRLSEIVRLKEVLKQVRTIKNQLGIF